MMLKGKIALAAALVLGLLPQTALAGAFCVKPRGAAPQCLYDDATECRRRAAQLSGVCVANPDVLLIQPTNGKFCMVTSGHAVLCSYIDRSSCEREARRNSAVCIDSREQGVQPDPHRDDPNRRY